MVVEETHIHLDCEDLVLKTFIHTLWLQVRLLYYTSWIDSTMQKVQVKDCVNYFSIYNKLFLTHRKLEVTFNV